PAREVLGDGDDPTRATGVSSAGGGARVAVGQEEEGEIVAARRGERGEDEERVTWRGRAHAAKAGILASRNGFTALARTERSFSLADHSPPGAHQRMMRDAIAPR